MKQLFNYTVLRWKAFIIAWLQVGLDKLFLSLNVGVTLPVLQARAELQTLKHFWTCFVAYYSDLFLPLTQFQVYFNHLDPYMLSSMVTAFCGQVIKIDGSEPPSSKTRLLDFPLYLLRWHFICVVLFFFLVYMVVMHLKNNLTLGEFLMAIRYRPVALSLYIKVSLWKRGV